MNPLPWSPGSFMTLPLPPLSILYPLAAPAFPQFSKHVFASTTQAAWIVYCPACHMANYLLFPYIHGIQMFLIFYHGQMIEYQKPKLSIYAYLFIYKLYKSYFYYIYLHIIYSIYCTLWNIYRSTREMLKIKDILHK